MCAIYDNLMTNKSPSQKDLNALNQKDSQDSFGSRVLFQENRSKQNVR